MQLKVNEFRIGNLITYDINDSFVDRVPYHGKNIYVVKVIMEDSIKIDLGHGSLQRVLMDDPKLKPIRISEELLIRAGFEEVNLETYRIFLDKRKYGLMDIDLDLKVAFLMCASNGLEMCKTRYIHHVQNLYHSLTGRELKWN